MVAKPRQANASTEGSGTELRKRGENPSPVKGPGGPGVPKGFPVCTVNTDDWNQEFANPEALACVKEAPEAVFQTSTWIQAVPPPGTLLMVCGPPKK